MKIKQIEYPAPVIELFAIKSGSDLKEMKREYKEITGRNLKEFHNIVQVGNKFKFVMDSIDDYPYECLVIKKVTEYINCHITVRFDENLMHEDAFNVHFKEVEN